jgi:hypothetical protein
VIQRPVEQDGVEAPDSNGRSRASPM